MERRLMLVALALCISLVACPLHAAERKSEKRKACHWENGRFTLVTPGGVNLPQTDAWAPQGGRIVLTNDCQFWLNANCSVIQKIGGCNDANGCTEHKCVVNNPKTCSPQPTCIYRMAACTYRKTCENSGVQGEGVNQDLLNGKRRVPAPRAACIFNSTSNKFQYKRNQPFWRRIKRSDAWAPAPGRKTRTGDCKVVLDEMCNVKEKSGGCGDGEVCQFTGNKNTLRSCSPFPTCFFRSAKCVPASGNNQASSQPIPSQPTTLKPSPSQPSPSQPAPTPSPPKKDNSDNSEPSLRASGVDDGGNGDNGDDDPVIVNPAPSTGTYDVRNYGAKGDGQTDDTNAIKQAMSDACNAARNSNQRKTVSFPGGLTFLTRPLHLDGSKINCGPGITFQLDGTISASDDCGHYQGLFDGLSAVLVVSKVDGFQIVGKGTIDGNGDKWWVPGGRSCDKPQGLSIRYSDNILVDGITITHPGQMHLITHVTKYVTIQNFKTRSPATSPNTDSIHLEYTEHAVIKNCDLMGGDDAISIVHASRDIVIDKVTVFETHGFSIGSLGKDEQVGCVKDIVMTNLKLTNSLFGTRIKTYQGGFGCVNNITYRNVEMTNTGVAGIILDQWYCNGKLPYHCGEDSKGVSISDITFENFSGDVAEPGAIQLKCSKYVPCNNINLKNIKLTNSKFGPSIVENAVVSAQGVSTNLPQSNIQGLSGDAQDHISKMRSFCQ